MDFIIDFLSDYHQWNYHHVMVVSLSAVCGIVIVILTALAIYFYNLVRRERFKNRVMRSAAKKASIRVPTDVIEMEEADVNDVSEFPSCGCAKPSKKAQKPKKQHRRDEKKRKSAD